MATGWFGEMVVETLHQALALRIITWNVERPGIRSPKNAIRVGHIRGLEPDIAVLTETSRGVDLGEGYSGFFTDPSPRKPREGEAVAAVWLKNSVCSALERVPTGDPREAICLRVETTEGPVIIYGSIIPYHGWKGPDGVSSAWEEHERAILWHRSDWVRIRSAFPDDEVITAGDYNQHRDGKGRYGTRRVRRLLSEAFFSADLVCVTEEDLVEAGKLSRRTIDHVCLSRGLVDQVRRVDGWEGTLDGTRLSDHNGILVDLSATGR